MTHPKRLLGALVLVALFAIGCGDDPEFAVPADALDMQNNTEVALTISDNAFDQRVVAVTAGTTITWTNDGRNPHDVRPDIPDEFEAAAPPFDNGETGAVTFDTPGEFAYYCSVHGAPGRGQTGTIIVVPG